MPDGPAAPEGLTAIVREALPEAWRTHLRVLVSTGSFMVGFCDEKGRQHAFDVRKVANGSPAFITGQALGYSYTLVDPRIAEDVELEAYRSALAALAARESEILPWLTLPAASEDGDGAEAGNEPRDDVDYPDLGAAPEALTRRVVVLLPTECQPGAEVVLIPDGFAVKFQDATSGIRHVLEARPLVGGFPALVRGRQFGFSYLKVDEALDEAAMVPRYREVLRAFVEQERQLAADLAAAPPV